MSYFYDWQRRDTDDPSGWMPSPEDCDGVFLNGEKVTDKVQACRTGTKGWVRIYAKRGITFVIEADNKVKTLTLHGIVEVRRKVLT